VYGSYLHGLFGSDGFRRAFLARLDIPSARQCYRARVDDALDALAVHVENHLDVDGLFALAR
jgi:adenosylcobyric acid synthase